MCPSFTDDDVGKTVVNASGDTVGVIAAVETGSARVDPDPGVTDTIKAALGWEGSTEETVSLEEHAVESITAEAVHLTDDRSAQGGAAGDEDGSDAGEPAVNDDDLVTGTGRDDEGLERDEATDHRGREVGGEGASEEAAEQRSEDDEDDENLAVEPAIDTETGVDPETGESIERTDGTADETDETEIAADREVEPIDDSEERSGSESNQEVDRGMAVEPGSEENRGIAVDPEAVTGRDPEAEVRPGEAEDERTDEHDDELLDGPASEFDGDDERTSTDRNRAQDADEDEDDLAL